MHTTPVENKVSVGYPKLVLSSSIVKKYFWNVLNQKLQRIACSTNKIQFQCISSNSALNKYQFLYRQYIARCIHYSVAISAQPSFFVDNHKPDCMIHSKVSCSGFEWKVSQNYIIFHFSPLSLTRSVNKLDKFEICIEIRFCFSESYEPAK